MDAATLAQQLPLLGPELILTGGILAFLLAGALMGDRIVGPLAGLAVVVVVVAGATAAFSPVEGEGFIGGFVVDPLARTAKVIIALTAAAGLILSGRYLAAERLARIEYPILILFATLGMMIMVSSRDLLVLYVGLEMQSLSLYVLAAFNRDSARASESGLKYFVLGALSSGLLLYGSSLIYGFTGSIQFTEIAATVAGGPSLGLIFGLVFVICGLAFKVSAAPFHMWTPDVYQGAPTPVTAFFAAAPKLAAMVLFARVLVEPFDAITQSWSQVLALIAAFSIVVGSLGALTQTNIKRLMAYSSIANMGFALVALAAGTQAGVRGMLIYMTIYIITTVGLFACILAMRRREGMVEEIDDLKGLSKSHPTLALAMTLLLFSIAGIPPLAGFFGKFLAFVPAWEAGLYWLVIVAALGSVVAAYYYLRLLRFIWFDDAEQPLVPAPRELALIAGGAAALTFPILILPGIASSGLAALNAAAGSLF